MSISPSAPKYERRTKCLPTYLLGFFLFSHLVVTAASAGKVRNSTLIQWGEPKYEFHFDKSWPFETSVKCDIYNIRLHISNRINGNDFLDLKIADNPNSREHFS